MSTRKKRVYRVIFHNQGKVYELYATSVSQGGLFGFVEVSGFVFGERATVVIDPGEEKLKAEFGGVKSTFVPMHAVVRIDEVEKEGTAKISAAGEDAKVAYLPSPIYTPPRPVD